MRYRQLKINACFIHDGVIKWKQFPRNWPFVRGIHRSPVNFPHTGQWCVALMFSLICAWINGWVNNRKADDLRRHRVHYDVTVMCKMTIPYSITHNKIIKFVWDPAVFVNVVYRCPGASQALRPMKTSVIVLILFDMSSGVDYITRLFNSSQPLGHRSWWWKPHTSCVFRKKGVVFLKLLQSKRKDENRNATLYHANCNSLIPVIFREIPSFIWGNIRSTDNVFVIFNTLRPR